MAASKQLVDHALARFSTDNLSCMIVRFNKTALLDSYNNKSEPIGVAGDPSSVSGKMSEVDKILDDAKRKVVEDGVPGIGVSGSNSGKGHDPSPEDIDVFKQRETMEKVVEEEPGLVDGDTPEMALEGVQAISQDTRSTLSKGIPEGVASSLNPAEKKSEDK